MSPPFRRGIFVLERCGAGSGKSAETKMKVRGANGHHFDLASSVVDHRVTRSVPVIPSSPQTLLIGFESPFRVSTRTPVFNSSRIRKIYIVNCRLKGRNPFIVHLGEAYSLTLRRQKFLANVVFKILEESFIVTTGFK